MSFEMKGLSLISFVLHFCLISGSVPLFIWSNDKSIEYPQVIAGHHTTGEEFVEKYLKKVDNNVVMFVQDDFSVFDILSHGGVYGSNGKTVDYEHLKEAMMEFSATYLPNVKSPVESLLKLSAGDKSLKIVSVDPENIIHSLRQADLSKKSLFVVNLSQSKKTVNECDEILNEVISFLKDKCMFTAFFTGKQSEIKFLEVPEKHEKIRHLMSSENISDTPIIDGSFMLKFDSMSIDTVNNTIPMSAISVKENGCNDLNDTQAILYNCTVLLNIDTPEYDEMTLSFLFSTSGGQNPGYWFVKQTILTYTNQTKQATVNMTKNLIGATPLGFSYSCYGPPSLKALSSKETGVPTLIFQGLQIEVFMDKNSTAFGHYNECVGFFSPEIWMFLICASILLTILAFGIIMLLGINTMDRYDDPKGKTITVAAGD